MANLLQFQNASKAYGLKKLFDSADFSVDEGEHIGVIGANGAGKSTLFRILVGQETLDNGIYAKSRDLRMGYLAQEDDWKLDTSLEHELEERASKPLWKMKEIGLGLGLKEEQFSQPLKELSGGFRMRAQLLTMLAAEPNLMLLDEPTNYLDLESLLFLEHFLVDYPGAFLLISHDRRFLKRVADHILEVEAPDLTKFPGDIDDYFEEKRVLREQLEREVTKQENKRKDIMDFVNRFRAKASKARQAQSRMKFLEKMPTIEIKALPVGAQIKIPAPMTTSKLIVRMTEASLGYPGKTILRDVRFEIERGDHIGVVGPNGAGKSTLLKALSGLMTPQVGAIEWGQNMRIGYFAQHLTESLDLKATVESEMQRKAHPDVLPQEVRNLAGSLLFRDEEDLRKRVGVLSGGEKSRVALGQILLQKNPVLVLDEPTNHLDFDTVESLSQALAAYPGTLIVVSHDRDFISRVSNKILQIDHGQVLAFPGTYDEYAWSVERGSYGGAVTPAKPVVSDAPSAANLPRVPSAAGGDLKERRKELNRDLRSAQELTKVLERDTRSLEARVAKITADLNQAGQSPAKLAELGRDLHGTQTKLEATEEQWILCLEKIEHLEKSLALS
ncbi:MAG: ABC-F family ATP-binding cassette domain-containing protein [Bdellovibrionota bacterium]